MPSKEKRALVFAGSLVTACNLHHVDSRPPAAQVVDTGGVSENTSSPDAIHLDASNPFFADFGSNHRACGTCHHEDQGWTTTPAFVQTVDDGDALFAFDGSDCLPPGAANPSAARNSTELRRFGNIRIELPVPSSADYTLVGSSDPLGCPEAPSAAGLRMYRRPLPTANSAFLATVMWDGRESQGASVTEDLQRQANDATLLHAQATASLSVEQRAKIVAFETGSSTHATRSATWISRTTPTGGRHFFSRRSCPAFRWASTPPSSPDSRA